MNTRHTGCKSCGADLVTGRMSDGARVLVCAPCGELTPLQTASHARQLSSAVMLFSVI